MPRRKNDLMIDPSVFASIPESNAPRDHAVLIKLTAEEHNLFRLIVAAQHATMAHTARSLIMGHCERYRAALLAAAQRAQDVASPYVDGITPLANALAANPPLRGEAHEGFVTPDRPKPLPRSAAVQSQLRPLELPVPPAPQPPPQLLPLAASAPAPVAATPAPGWPPNWPPPAQLQPTQPSAPPPQLLAQVQPSSAPGEDMGAFIRRIQSASPLVQPGEPLGFTETPMPFDPTE